MTNLTKPSIRRDALAAIVELEGYDYVMENSKTMVGHLKLEGFIAEYFDPQSGLSMVECCGLQHSKARVEIIFDDRGPPAQSPWDVYSKVPIESTGTCEVHIPKSNEAMRLAANIRIYMPLAAFAGLLSQAKKPYSIEPIFCCTEEHKELTISHKAVSDETTLYWIPSFKIRNTS
jgi:hypothetical protein